MIDGLAALVLAAGEGRRLRPLTDLRPKPLCPVGDTTFLDLALARVAAVTAADATVVNAHHLADQIAAHVGDRARLSVEQPAALGTAGAVGAIRDWLDGRDVLISNGDIWFGAEPDLDSFVAGWDRERPRLLVVRDEQRADFDGGLRFAGVSLLPGAAAARLEPVPSGLYEVLWRHTSLDLVVSGSTYLDCADPATYLAANLEWSGGSTVIGSGAEVRGECERCVVWPGAVVHDGEHLVEVIRARAADGSDLTVPARTCDKV